MPKIVIIGAGSSVFSRNIIADVLWHESLRGSEIVLVDIDQPRLDTALGMAQIINRQLNGGATLRATRDRLAALPGADFVICTIGVGGLEATRIDMELPAAFGVRQTIADTLGVGGIFRAARSVPELLRIGADIERLCPRALLINYTNPMAMHCLAVHRATRVRCVGLCHGVQNTAQTLRMIVAMLDRPAAEISAHFARPWNDPTRVAEWQAWLKEGLDPQLSYTCAGINHMAFFLRFESAGRDLYPALRRVFEIPHMLRMDPVRFELMRWLGYFMTETSGHTAEYTPYFLKDETESAARHLRINGYIQSCIELEEMQADLAQSVRTGAPMIKLPYAPSIEYCSRIIHAVVTDRPFVFNGNVHNRGGALIGNLPGDACVEVPCVASRGGIAPTCVGDLPPQCAALIRTNINVQDLTVRAILEGSRERLYQAVMMDPNTASTLTLPKMREMCDAMVKAHASRLPRSLGGVL